jgi:hypothetical protein
LDELQEFIIENDIKLLIIDSIGSLVRKEYQNPIKNHGWGGPLVERNDVLLQQASKLKNLLLFRFSNLDCFFFAYTGLTRK